jgi:S-adenosylmethionine-diacylgycerolhomoserine-N-methlytransferase
MDQMYSWTRHVYDATRRYYLLGRDPMLERISRRPAGAVLEIGCGTARNLRVLAETAPHHTLYGLDASLAMLATARTALDREGCMGQVTLAQGLAENFNPTAQLGVEGPFDVIFFSYVLSMIPKWRAALARALTHLAPNGRLYIVDFWDQADLPPGVASLLHTWLSLFNVHPRPELLRTLRALETAGCLSCAVVPVARRYAYLVVVEPRIEWNERSIPDRSSSPPSHSSLAPTALPVSI